MLMQFLIYCLYEIHRDVTKVAPLKGQLNTHSSQAFSPLLLPFPLEKFLTMAVLLHVQNTWSLMAVCMVIAV